MQDEYSSGAKRQNIGQMLRSLSLYNSILPTSNEDPESTIKGSSNGANGNNNNGKNRNGKPQAAAKLGTIMGVYIPCLQNIFGVLFFIRLPWIVGTAGVLEAFLVTFLTSISLSAIATNGVVSGGGPYYMVGISRNLGPELGGAVGILFYLGTTIAASMYIIGAVEIFLIYIMPQAKVFDDMYHNFRLFGSILLILVGLIVLAGVKIVNKFALPAVLVVIACIVCTFVGIFLKFGGTDSLKFCMVGNRPVDLSGFHAVHGYIPNCTDEGLRNSAIPGLSSGVFYENLYSKYRRNGDVLTKLQSKTPELPPDPNNKQNSFWVFSDTTTSFILCSGVFFPSVTGIMAGSNRSGNLRDASKSIPVGTLGAQVIAELAIPHPLLILIGCCSSTIGAGMQSLTGAPRLLQAISADDVIPFLRPFQKTDRRGEPIKAIFLTLCICWLGWRPSFRYFHWSLSTLGAFLCIAVMFISAWYFALVAIFIGAAVYKYIEYAGAEKEWGDGLKGLALSAARFALLNVDSRGIMHTRNWRPQILVLYPSKKMEQLYSNLENTRKGLLAFVAQLKAGKGLTLIAECIEGQFAQISKNDISTIKEELQDAVKESRIRGFCDVLVTEHFMQGISHLIQTSGLGGLRHNR
uniref:Amino acid permease/ SLC12A domain-containing protein n=1 Tax=Meloidogyne javanica TaxID=6303 RepID=A0A915MZQ2_MELJA